VNATLEKALAALTPEEKAEVIDFLLPDVVGGDTDEVPADLLAELERRDAAYEADPAGAMTLREFDKKWFGRE
jgi:hypothetical protein